MAYNTTDKTADKLADSKRRRKRQGVYLYILLGICLAAVLVFGGWLGYELFTDWQSSSYYSALAADVETRPRSPGDRPPRPVAPPSGGGYENETNGDEYPEYVEDPWVPYVDFEVLSERFPGIVGWIRLDGTQLDYPIVQGTDNNFYLGHLPDRTRHRSGSIFMDFRNEPDFSDRNTLIYGHMSRTDDMFGALKHYRTQAFFDQNPVMYIHTPETDFQLVIFAGYIVDSGVESPTIRFRDDESFEEYIASIRRRSEFRSDVEVTAQDRIVSLCTCQYDFDNARLVIVGKLVEF